MNRLRVVGRKVFRDGVQAARIAGGRWTWRGHVEANFGIILLNPDGSDGTCLSLKGYTYFRDIVKDIDSLIAMAEKGETS